MSIKKLENLLVDATEVTTGEVFQPKVSNRSYQVSAIADAGANASATVKIEVSNYETKNYELLAEFTFSSINDSEESKIEVSRSAIRFVRARIVSISGSGMKINAVMNGGD